MLLTGQRAVRAVAIRTIQPGDKLTCDYRDAIAIEQRTAREYADSTDGLREFR